MATKKLERRIEDAFLELAAEKPFHDIRLAEVARRAETDLAELRETFDGPFAILSSFVRRIDIAVLDGTDASLAAEPRREHLFDALMRRYDRLAPYRAGLAGLQKSACRDPLLAWHMARLSCGSQTWILESAGIPATGLLGRLRAPALAAALTRVFSIFLADTEEGLPKTMAALNETLDRLVGIDRRARAACDFVAGLGRRRRQPPPAAEPTAAGA